MPDPKFPKQLTPHIGGFHIQDPSSTASWLDAPPKFFRLAIDGHIDADVFDEMVRRYNLHDELIGWVGEVLNSDNHNVKAKQTVCALLSKARGES